MEQIIVNWTVILILPLVFGVLFRVSLAKDPKGWRFTLGCVLAAVVMQLIARFAENHGSEGNGIWALMLTFCAVGAVAVEVFCLLRRVGKKEI